MVKSGVGNMKLEDGDYWVECSFEGIPGESQTIDNVIFKIISGKYIEIYATQPYYRVIDQKGSDDVITCIYEFSYVWDGSVRMQESDYYGLFLNSDHDGSNYAAAIKAVNAICNKVCEIVNEKLGTNYISYGYAAELYQGTFEQLKKI